MHSESQLSQCAVLIENSGNIEANELAHALGKKLGVQVHTIPSGKSKKPFTAAQFLLVFTEKGLVLRIASEPTWSDIMVDFASSALQYRKQHGGGRNESVAKAIGIKGKNSVNVLDCTAGMGTDSFIMASVGANVTMLERSPVIASLLDNGLLRAQQAGVEVANKLQLMPSDAIEYLQANASQSTPIDVVYLDPMFPHKKKSALVKKEMRAFQLLVGPDQDSGALLTAAINFAPQRIVVKRPASAQALENAQGMKPSMAISSKKHRFDVYILQQVAPKQENKELS